MLSNKRFTSSVQLAIAAAVLLAGTACSNSNDSTQSPPGATTAAEQPAVTATSDQPAITATADAPLLDAELEATEAYVQQVEVLMAELAAAADAVGSLMSEADVQSAAWRNETTVALGRFQAVHEQAEGLEAGGDGEGIQERLLVATETYYHAAALLGDSIESLDLDALEEANVALGDALLATAEVRLLIDELANG
jgi:hypothetical protein